MSTINDGGPAFPSESYDAEVDSDTVKPGMSLRDWLAGQALSNQALGQAYHNRPDLLAEHAYEYADAMLTHREKKGA